MINVSTYVLLLKNAEKMGIKIEEKRRINLGHNFWLKDCFGFLTTEEFFVCIFNSRDIKNYCFLNFSKLCPSWQQVNWLSCKKMDLCRGLARHWLSGKEFLQMDYISGVWYLMQEKGITLQQNQYLVNLASFRRENRTAKFRFNKLLVIP